MTYTFCYQLIAVHLLSQIALKILVHKMKKMIDYGHRKADEYVNMGRYANKKSKNR